jgi:hypothetical protein
MIFWIEVSFVFLGSELIDQYKSVMLKNCIKNRLIGSGFEHMFDVNVKSKHISTLLLTPSEVYELETLYFFHWRVVIPV